MENLKNILIKKNTEINLLKKNPKNDWFNKKIKFQETYKYFKKGFTITPNALLETKNLSNNDKMVLINLLNFAFGGLTCFPSLKTLSLKTGLTKPSIITSVKKLEKLKYLMVEREIGGSNTYIINMSIFNEI